MAILTLMLGNIKKKKGNFISIFILILIITTSLISITSSIINGRNRFKESCKECNSPDAFNRVEVSDYSKAANEKLLKDKSIKDITSTMTIKYSGLKIKNKIYPNSFYLSSTSDTKERFKLEDKSTIKDIKKGEIYFPEYFKSDYNCKIGDIINIKTSKTNLKLKISGFFEDPLLGSNLIGTKRALISDEDLDTLSNIKSSEVRNVYLINIYLNHNVKDASKTLDRVNKDTHLDSYGYESNFTCDLEGYTFLMPNIICSILIGFSILLFIIVMIVISYSINSNIEMDYASFGILKAMGFTNFGVRAILLLQYLSSAILGAIFGIILSRILVSHIGNVVLSGTGLLYRSSLNYVSAITIILVVLGLITLFNLLFTRKVIKITPVRAISAGYSPVYFSNRLNFSLDKLKFIPLSIKMAWKQIITHIKQYVSLVIVIIILTFFAISISSLGTVFESDNVAEMFGEEKSDITINYSDKTKDLVKDIKSEIEKQDKIKYTFIIYSNYYSYENKSRLVKMYNKISIKPIEGRNPKYDNEVLMTTSLAEKLHKNIGDEISVIDKNGKSVKYIIVGKNQNVSDTGINISMLTSGYKRIDKDYKFNTLSISIENSQKTKKIISDLKKKYNNYSKNDLSFKNDYKSMHDFLNTITSSIDLAVDAIYLISILVIGLVTILICNKTLNQERLDIGIYKAQGFSDKYLRVEFSLRTLMVTIISTVIGLVLNFIFNNNLLSAFMKTCGITNFNSEYTFSTIAAPIIIIYFFVIIFSYTVTRKIKRLSPKLLISD